MTDAQTFHTATFGAGCFWGVEESFRALDGVIDTMVGYEGGVTENPSYREVCTDRTGHAEVVQVTFDPGVMTYETLLAKLLLTTSKRWSARGGRRHPCGEANQLSQNNP